MARERLYIVHGMGPDAVGLVGGIAGPVAASGSNIVDLKQDVLHGMFIIYMVVDLSGCAMRLDELKKTVQAIAEDTGLELAVDKYNPVPRNPDKKSMLVILVGADRPGIIASMAQTLGNYRINIESAQNIGREGVFLMELMTDVSHCTIPLDNVTKTLRETMAPMGITAMFQSEDVFNKRKRIVLFDLSHSLMDAPQLAEICRQTGISRDEVGQAVQPVSHALEGFAVDIYNEIIGGISVLPDTMELLQTLRTMGYRIGLNAACFSQLADHLRGRLGIDYGFGVTMPVDDDSRTFAEAPGTAVRQPAAKLADLLSGREQVRREDVTVIADDGGVNAPGIRLEFNLEKMLDLYNKRVVGRQQLAAILASFGQPR